MDRRLCAIMFTDIQGYTKLMQESEQKAIETRNRHRSVFGPLTRQYGGEIIQYYGDGTLSIFNSSVQAVECAKALQIEFLKEPAIPVRIGIHTGDIVLTEDDIIGDSVNLASRIESLGVPGSVLVSGKVADEIRSQEHLPLKKIGSFHFKNESREREVFALNLPGFSQPDPESIQGKLEPGKKPGFKKRFNRKHLIYLLLALVALSFLLNYVNRTFFHPPIKRLAVLPFNTIDDTDQKHWAHIDREIYSELQQAGLDVEPWRNVKGYRNSEKSVTEICKELDVDGLIEGSVSRQQGILQIDIELLDGLRDEFLWGHTYESKVENLIVTYREVAKTIAKEISAELSPEVEVRLAQVVTLDADAYELYMRGKEQFNIGSASSLREAVRYYKESMEKDPSFGRVYEALIETYLLMGFGSMDPIEALTNFRLYMEKAMDYNPALRSDFNLQAMVNIFVDHDWESAEENLQKALKQNDSSADLWNTYCQFLWAVGRTDESVKAGEKAVRMDPAYHWFSCNLIGAYLYNGQLDAAKKQLQTTIDSFGEDCPYHYAVKYKIILLEENREEFPNAIRELQEDISNNTVYFEYLGTYALLASFFAKMGDSVRALSVLDTLRNKGDEDVQDLGAFAHVYTFLGDYERAIDYLEQSYYRRDFLLLYTIKADPVYDPLRTHPRFKKLLQNLNLPPDT